MFFGDWLQRREMLSPSKGALIDAINDNQPITYREWNQQANQLANFFRDGLGLGKGDRVSIYAMNRVEYLDALFACNKLGAILHPLNWRLTVHELDALINDAAPHLVLKPGVSLAEADLIDWLRERMAHYKVPESAVFVDAFPKTAANKVEKQELIEYYGL